MPFEIHLRDGNASSDFGCGILKNMLKNKENGEAPKGLSIFWNDWIANLKYQILRSLMVWFDFVILNIEKVANEKITAVALFR